MKLSICNEIIGRDLTKAAEVASKVGCQGVELAHFTFCTKPSDLSTSERAKIKEVFSSRGLEICALHWIYASPPGLKLFSKSEEKRKEALKHTFDVIDLAVDLEAKIIVVGSPKQREIPPEVPRKTAEEWAVDFFRKAGEYAENRGVIVALEPLPSEDTNFINTTEEAVKLAERISSKYVRVMVDLMHVVRSNENLDEILRKYLSWIVHVHIPDIYYKPLNLKEAVTKVLKAGYTGYISLEHISPGVQPEESIERTISLIKKIQL